MLDEPMRTVGAGYSSITVRNQRVEPMIVEHAKENSIEKIGWFGGILKFSNCLKIIVR